MTPSTRKSSTNDDSIFDFYTKFPNKKDNSHHVEDLTTTPIHKPQVLVWVPSLTYVVYMQRVLKNIIITLMFEWSLPITHPISFLILVTLFPTLIVIVIVLELALHIALKLGLESLFVNFSNKWGEGLSIVNWWDPRIFEPKVNETVKSAINALHSPLPRSLPEEQLDDFIGLEGTVQHRGFHLDIAELLLFMSSIIYERNDILVGKAHKTIKELAKENEKNNDVAGEKIQSVIDTLKQSEDRIHEQAKRWGLRFTSLSELNSLGGPFAGMFWHENHNFIVVVFKGTTPVNFEDFVVDLLLQRVDARSFVYGEVHEGFYTSLFPQGDFSSPRSSRASPYVTIVRAIRAKAADINARRKEKVKINVWITGHSLGAALGSLFYARLVKAPEDLGPNCVLRDGYAFGSPCVGDADFAAEFASYSNVPYDRQSTLWRIVDDKDIIPHIPQSWNDPTIRRVIDKGSFLNYAHIGEGIKFFQNGDRPVSTTNLFSSGKEPVIIEHDAESYGFFGWFYKSKPKRSVKNDIIGKNKFEEYKHKAGSPLGFVIDYLLPRLYKDHFPGRYFAAMEKARVYFDDPTADNTVNEGE